MMSKELTKHSSICNVPNNQAINALDLIGDKVEPIDLAKAQAYLEANYGLSIPKEKMKLLFDAVREANWTKERFKRTLTHILRTKPYVNWTIADWFEYGVTLHPYSWYLEQVQQGNADKIEAYSINGKTMYKLADGEQLPFEKVDLNKSNKTYVDLQNAIAYYRQEIKSEPTENEKGKMLERIKSNGVQFVIDKIDEYVRSL